MIGVLRRRILQCPQIYTRNRFPIISSHRNIQLTNKDQYNETYASLAPKNTLVPGHGSSTGDVGRNYEKGIDKKKDTAQNDLIKTLSEQLILETNLNLHKPTVSENQVDTLQVYQKLLAQFTPIQSKAIMSTMLYLLNEQFYGDYNDKFLRDFEIDKQDHLFNSLRSEIQYVIENTRDGELHKHHLQLVALKRDLDSIVDETNELIIDQYVKNCKLEFNEHKNANTLLYKRINLNLNDCSNKITIQIISGIRSEIENLRWQTTRSGLLAVIILASSFLIGVNISSRKSKPPVNTGGNAENQMLTSPSLNDEQIAKLEDMKKDIDIII